MDVDNFFINQIHKFGAQLAEEIINIQNRVFKVDYKEDSSPLTEADLHSNQRIKEFLLEHSNIKNFISEEDREVDYKIRKSWDYYWIIDPIDGTKEFVKGGDDFCVNIALCYKGSPIYGHVIRPRTRDQYYAIKNGGAFKNLKSITSSKLADKEINVVASKSHLNDQTENYLSNLNDNFLVNIVNIGSALKICLVAEGKAHIYPRYGPTMEWDTCAPQIIVEEAGGLVLDVKNKSPLVYNKDDLLNPFFIVYSNLGFLAKKFHI